MSLQIVKTYNEELATYRPFENSLTKPSATLSTVTPPN